MKRSLRVFFNTHTAASLLLSVVTGMLWVRSFASHDQFTRGTPNGEWSIRSLRGRIILEQTDWFGDDPPAPHWRWDCHSADDLLPSDGQSPWRNFEWEWNEVVHLACILGIEFKSVSPLPSEPPHTHSPLMLAAPHWLAVIVFGMPPLWVWQRRRKRRRYLSSLTCVCGYDLRATPNQCPECGVVPRH